MQIVIGAGKGGMTGDGTSGPFGSPSPMNAVYDAIVALNIPGVEIIKVDWNTPGIGALVTDRNNLILIPHSFCGQTVDFLCQSLWNYVRQYGIASSVTVIFIEPVRWTFKDDVEKIDDFGDSALAQVLDRTPFQIPPNVKACYVFRRSQLLGPFTNPVDRTIFDKKSSGDHNTCVASALPEILEIVKGLA